MGCKISCALFEKFSTFIHWLVNMMAGRDTLDHYLDDFIFCGDQDSDSCEILLNTFMAVCKDLSIPLADDKAVDPCSRLIFLGLEIDSDKMVVNIPVHKKEETREVLLQVLKHRKMKLREFQSMIGKLAFLCRAVRSSRAFFKKVL